MAAPRPETLISAERWQRLQDLFYAAAEMAAPERIVYLDQECATDPTLRLQVESLLLASGDSCQLAEEVVSAAAHSMLDPAEVVPGGLIGAYRIQRLLGRGGMGEVYLAERADDAYRKQVAIKLVRAGCASGEALHRFRAERQILATLEHTHIARLLEGGNTASGVPFLVMEYVEGRSITDYCRELPLRARLELFRTVCEAVQYAHANLVVHRDLKPSNIMVTGAGVVKLVDFGIAKLLLPDEDAPGVTLPLQRLLTPEYASPEQFFGEPITTAADVYSLGVILYELTTGSLPYEFSARSVAEMERLVREVEPALPSTRGNDRRLRGDIDNIITKALRKEPQQRYASAADLSSDIGRWLEGYPVQARKPSRRYRATKFVRRHRLGVAAAAVMVLILAGGIVSTRRAQLRAERRFADVRALANTFLFDFQGAIREVPGTLPAQALVVRKAQEYLDRLASEASGDQGLETDLALSYDRLADIQYSGGQLRLGNVAAALSNVKKAIALREALVAQAPSNSVYRQSLGNSYNRVGSIMRQGTDAASAIPYNEKAIQLLDTCLRERPRDRELRQNTAEAYKNAADAYRMLGTWPTAVKYSERAIELRDGLVREDANDTVDRSSLAVAYTGLGDTLRDSIGYAIPPGRTFGALECYRRSFEIQDALSVQSPGDALRRRNSALARGRLARALMAANDLTAARRYFAEAADIYSDLFQHDVANGELERSLSVAQLNLAKLDEQTGNYALASTGLEKAIHARRSLVARDADSLEAQDDLAYALAEIGAVQIKLTRLERARQNLTEALRLRESVESKRPRNVEDKARLGACFASIGDLEKAGRHWSAAEESYRKALATFVRLRDEGKLQDRDQPLLQSLPKQIAAARAHGE